MAAQQGQSSFLAGLGDQLTKSHQAHKDDPVEIALPPGIGDGVAQLVDCKIGTYKEGANKGKPFFFAAGVVKSPKEHDGVKCEGQRTQIGPEALCNTPQAQGKRKTFDDHYAWFLGQLKLLGFDAATIEATDPKGIEAALLAGMQALRETKPHFRFRTWRGEPTKDYPNPRTSHFWEGVCEYTESGDPATNHAKDRTAGGASENGDGGNDSSSSAPGDDTDSSSGSGFSEFGDIASLVEAANRKDRAAQQKLMEIAANAGVDAQAIEDAPDWETLVQLIETAQGGSSEESSSDEPEDQPKPDPEKGHVYNFHPEDPKTGKPVKKPVECEVIAVYKKAETVDLMNLTLGRDAKGAPKKVYKGVKWDDLVSVE